MTDFRDPSRFVGQSGSASFDSGDVGKLSGAKTEGICKNERRKLFVEQYFTEWKAETTVGNTTPHLAHLSPAEYSAEVFHKISAAMSCVTSLKVWRQTSQNILPQWNRAQMGC